MSSNFKLAVGFYGYDYGLTRRFNEAAHGARNLEEAARRNTKQMGMWDQQMRAFGTTLRYALAGGAAYAAFQGIQALSQYERKLGDIAALAASSRGPGALDSVKDDMQALSNVALQTSNSLAMPVDQIQTMMQTFYSSFKVPAGVTGTKQLAEFSDTVGRLARVSETTDLTKLTEGVIGFANALEGGRGGVPKTASEIAKTVATSVGFRGDVLAMNIGRLGGAAAQGGFTGPEILGLLTKASQTGGSAQVIARGITQLGTNILDPGTPERQQAYRDVGLPTDPAQLARMGGMAVLEKIMAGVAGAGGLSISRAGARVSNDVALEEEGMQRVPSGLTGGGTGLAYRLFGQVESLRQFASIMNESGTSLDEFITQIDEAGKSAGSTSDVLKVMYDAVKPFSELSQAGISLQNLRLQATKSLDPILHPISKALTRVSDEALRHPRVTQAATAAFLVSSGLYAAHRMIPGGLRIPGLTSMSRTLGNPAAKALAAEEAASAFGVNQLAQPKGTKTDPLWVVIAPLTKYVNEPDTFGGGGGVGKDKDGEGRGPGKFVPAIMPWLGPAVAATAGVAIRKYVEDPVLNQFSGGMFGKINRFNPYDPLNQAKWQMDTYKKVYEGLRHPGRDYGPIKESAFTPGKVEAAFEEREKADERRRRQEATSAAMYGRLTQGERVNRLQNIPSVGNIELGQLAVQIAATDTIPINLQLDPKFEKVMKLVDPTIHLPVKFFHEKAPKSRGKYAKTRGGGR